MKRQIAFIILTFMILIVLALNTATNSSAQPNAGSLVVEKEQHYETYMIGGTCIFATHNLLLTDLDNDGDTEIVTGGYTYDLDNGSRMNPSAPLKIWSWDSLNLTLETSYKWPDNSNATAMIVCVTAGDINQDGNTELVTVGGIANATARYAQLRIWRWNGIQLTLQANCEFEGLSGKNSVPPGQSNIAAAIISDADKDGTPEIFTVGRTFHSGTNETEAQIIAWHWDQSGLIPWRSMEWNDDANATANSLYAADLNNDGETEIVTAGYNHDLANSSGQIRIWRWTGQDFNFLGNAEWRTVEGKYALTSAGGIQGNTVVNNVKAGDVDGDGTPEIVTGGFTYDGEKVNGQLRVWNWTGQAVALEMSYEWTSEAVTEAKSITLNDVDDDGSIEIVISGVTAGQSSFSENASVKELAQLKVWNWNGATLTLKQSNDWTVGEGVCAWNVASGDVDEDEIVEIVTVGCMYVTNMCDPDLRIWSIAEESLPSPTATPEPKSESQDWQMIPIVAAALSVAVIAVAAGYLLIKRPHKQKKPRIAVHYMVWFQ